MDGSVKAADAAFKEITADLDESLDQQRTAQDKAGTDFLTSIGLTVGKADAARDESRKRQLEAELAAQSAILQNVTATESQKRVAFERSAEIQEELSALQVRVSIQNAEEEYASRASVEERKRQALAETGLTAEQIEVEMAKDAAVAADKTRVSWDDAVHTIIGSITALGSLFGGLGEIAQRALTSIGSGVSSIVSGFKVAKESGAGFLGTLTQVAGMAGALGGLLNVVVGIGQALGVGDLSETLVGGKLSLQQLVVAAEAGDQGAIAKLRAIIRDPSAATLSSIFVDKWGRSGDWGSLATRMAIWRDTIVAWDNLFGPGSWRTAHAGGVIGVSDQPDGRRLSLGELVGAERFHGGGMIGGGGSWLAANERPIIGRVGELVLPTDMTQRLAGLLGQGSRGSESHVSTDNSQRSLSVNVYLSGVSDQDIPRRVVEAIKGELGHDFQKNAMLAGNARLD